MKKAISSMILCFVIISLMLRCGFVVGSEVVSASLAENSDDVACIDYGWGEDGLFHLYDVGISLAIAEPNYEPDVNEELGIENPINGKIEHFTCLFSIAGDWKLGSYTIDVIKNNPNQDAFSFFSECLQAYFYQYPDEITIVENAFYLSQGALIGAKSSGQTYEIYYLIPSEDGLYMLIFYSPKAYFNNIRQYIDALNPFLQNMPSMIDFMRPPIGNDYGWQNNLFHLYDVGIALSIQDEVSIDSVAGGFTAYYEQSDRPPTTFSTDFVMRGEMDNGSFTLKAIKNEQDQDMASYLIDEAYSHSTSDDWIVEDAPYISQASVVHAVKWTSGSDGLIRYSVYLTIPRKNGVYQLILSATEDTYDSLEQFFEESIGPLRTGQAELGFIRIITQVETDVLNNIEEKDSDTSNMDAVGSFSNLTDASGCWKYNVINGAATIIGYEGDEPRGELTIPDKLDEYAVNAIAKEAFTRCHNITSVIISEGVAEIGDRAFYNCESLANVSLPQSVENIGVNPFAWCPMERIQVHPHNSTYVTLDGVLFNKEERTLIAYPSAKKDDYDIPLGILSIGPYAFYRCEELKSVTIPNSVTSIGSFAFGTCSSLTSLFIPDSVLAIGEGAFFQCQRLSEVSIPSMLATIENEVFKFCRSLTMITIPESVTSIGASAFNNCNNLNSIAIPDSVVSVGNSAFWNCYNLTDVVIPNSVTSIGDEAFYLCSSLSSITIPDSVMAIGANPFAGCNISQINVNTNNNNYTSVNGVLFDIEMEYLIAYPSAKNGVYGIPQGVITIGDSAFAYSKGLTGISIPSSVTTIGKISFYGCNSLKSIEIPNSVSYLGEVSFYECNSLECVVLSNNISRIEYNTFSRCSSLQNIEIPDSVTSIGSGAFSGCTDLANALFPDTPMLISNAVFDECENITLTVYYNSDAHQYAELENIPYIFYEDTSWLYN